MGVDDPDEFEDRGLAPVLKSDADAESAIPLTKFKAVFVKGSGDLAVPNCSNN